MNTKWKRVLASCGRDDDVFSHYSDCNTLVERASATFL